jgi:hypothetical protein
MIWMMEQILIVRNGQLTIPEMEDELYAALNPHEKSVADDIIKRSREEENKVRFYYVSL